MSSRWREAAMAQVCTLINGRAYSKPELLESGKYPVLRVGNFFTNNHWYYSDLELEPEKYCESGDLLYAWSASFGPRIWTGAKCIFHYHIWKVIPNQEVIDKRFLFMFLEWDAQLIKSEHGTGTTMIHVSKGSMEQRKIRFPAISEQRRIVAILDKAFESIAIARANAEKNLQNARELFESHLDSIFTKSLSGQKKPLGDLVVFRNGVNFTGTSRGETVRIVGVKDFQRNFWAPLEDLDVVTVGGVLPDSDLIKEGDLLFVRSNGNPELIGRCVLVGPVKRRTTYSGFTIRARSIVDGISSRYLCHFMKSAAVRREPVRNSVCEAGLKT